MVTRLIEVGSGSMSIDVGQNFGGWIYATAIGGIAPYTWTIWEHSGSSQVVTTPDELLDHYIGCDGGYLQVSANGSCGGTISASDFIPECSGGGFFLTVYPNPATDEINIARNPLGGTLIADRQSSVLGDMTLTLYDFSGQVARAANYRRSGGNISLDVSDLKSGNYFLKITGDGFDETHQIIVDR